MSKTTTSSVPHRAAYQRPYKTRQQRREADRQKTDESHDHKFLLRAGVGIAIVLAVVLGFMLKGLIDRDKAPAATVVMLR